MCAIGGNNTSGLACGNGGRQENIVAVTDIIKERLPGCSGSKIIGGCWLSEMSLNSVFCGMSVGYNKRAYTKHQGTYSDDDFCISHGNIYFVVYLIDLLC